MKKIIAAAVATAFVAPAFAADVTISGSMELGFKDQTTKAGVSTTKLNEDTAVVITASTETANGISVSADINMSGAGWADGGNFITLGGAFGKVDLGDTSGPVDAIDDKGDVFKTFDNGVGGDDVAVSWTLPTFVEGLTLIYGYSPENGGMNSDYGLNSSGARTTSADGISSDVEGFAVTYSMAGARVGYAMNDIGATTSESVKNINYTYGPAFVSYELHTTETTGSADTEVTSLAATYNMGAATLLLGKNSSEQSGTKSKDATTYGVHYDLGGGVTAFVESYKDDKASTTTVEEATTVGLVVAF